MRAIGKKGGLVSLQACKNHRIGEEEARGLVRRPMAEKKRGREERRRWDKQQRGLQSGVSQRAAKWSGQTSGFPGVSQFMFLILSLSPR